MDPTGFLRHFIFIYLRIMIISGAEVTMNRSVETVQQLLISDHLITAITDSNKYEEKTNTIPVFSINKTRSPRSAGLGCQMGLSAAEKSVEATSLSGLLVAVVQQELNDCDLVLAYDAGDLSSVVVQDLLLLLPNPRQVVLVRRAEDLAGVGWVSAGCGGYLLLLDHAEPLLTFANTYHHTWDYHGRYVMVSGSVEQVEALAATRNGKKTEHILGAVKSGQEGEWRVYINMLYWGEGVRPVTTWRHHRFTSQLDLFPDKLSDLRGTVLKVSTFDFPPNIMYYLTDNGTLLFRYGEDVAIVENLARALNFIIHFAEPADGYKWGYTVNGSWTGMIGDLVRDEADIGMANLFLMGYRYQIITLSAPYSHQKLCFMARVELPLPRWQALAFPFHSWTWLAIMVGLILSGPVLFLVATANGRLGDEAANFTVLSFSWQYSFGLHFCESQVVEPRMDSTRIFVLFLWLYTMILTIAYSTNLTAFLMVQKPRASMQTIKELSQSGFELAALEEGFMVVITNSQDPYVLALANIHKSYHYHEEETIFQRVLEGKSVFLENTGFLNYHIATRFTYRGVSSVRVMKECLTHYYIVFAMQRHSPLKRKFDVVIGWLQQSGIIRRETRDALKLAASTKEYGSESEDVGQEDGIEALKMDHVQGIFILAILGWFASFSLFGIEYIEYVFFMQ